MVISTNYIALVKQSQLYVQICTFSDKNLKFSKFIISNGFNSIFSPFLKGGQDF